MSYEQKDPAGPGAQPPVYSTPATNTGFEHQQQQYIQPAQQQQQQQTFHPEQTQAQNTYVSNPGAAPANNEHKEASRVMPIQALTSSPAPIQCPSCHQRSTTRVAPITGNTTHAWALAACAVCCLGCIPYCVESTKDVEQYCGNCGVKVATWHRSGRTDVHLF